MIRIKTTDKRRGWVKTAAILFFAVMLLLTFFSNTILNRSLPEVSAYVVEDGFITAKVMGIAVVETNQLQKIVLYQARTVKSVEIKKGDIVAQGDLLFTFVGSESAELDTARTVLTNLNRGYQATLLSVYTPDYSRENQEISDARVNLAEAITNRDAIITPSDDELNAARVETRQYKEQYDELTAQATALNESVRQAQRTLYDKESALRELEGEDLDPNDPIMTSAITEVDTAAAALENAARELEEIQAETGWAFEDYNTAKAMLDSLESAMNEYKAADDMVRLLNNNVEDLLFAFSHKQESDARSQALAALQLEAYKEDIAAQEEKVSQLEAESMGSEILSPAAGRVSYIGITAGEQTAYGKEMAIIEVIGSGVSAQFTVSTEMADRFKPGDTASVMGINLPKNAAAVLHSKEVKADDPTRTNLIFDIQNVKVGARVYITIGSKGTEYPAIVPNSAVRQDTNGAFVLTLSIKRTPLGNRYVTERKNVTIIEKDDSNSAVSGGINAGDSVIINSSKPLEPGLQVKLADS